MYSLPAGFDLYVSVRYYFCAFPGDDMYFVMSKEPSPIRSSVTVS